MSHATSAPDQRQSPGQLRRALRPLQVTSLALGCVIGFGCFILPGDFLAMAGPGGAVGGILLGAVAMVVISGSYGLMVETFPVAGGAFAYAYHALGRNHAFLCGWFLVLGYLSIVSLNATALGLLANFLAPDLFTRGYLYSVAGFEVYAAEALLACGAVVLVGAFHLRGVRDVGSLQTIMTLVLIAGVATVGVGALNGEDAALVNMSPAIPEGMSAMGAVLAVAALAPWLFVGFDTLPQAAEEFDFPASRGRRLMVIAIAAGTAMYIVVILATAGTLPWQTLVASDSVWATGDTVRASLGTPGLLVLGFAVLMAVLTGINGFYMASSRLLYGMARANALPGWFGRVDPDRGVPYNAILFIGITSLIAPWLGRQVILWIVDMSAAGIAVAYLYTCVAAFQVAGRRGRRGMRVSAACGALLTTGAILLLTVPGMPAFMDRASLLVLVAWAALGVVFYLAVAPRYRAMDPRRMDHLILGAGAEDPPGRP